MNYMLRDMIRKSLNSEFDTIYEIINDASTAYKVRYLKTGGKSLIWINTSCGNKLLMGLNFGAITKITLYLV